MKTLQHSLFLLTLLLSVTALQAQTADDIIANHIEAIGGREKLSGITSVQFENTLQIMGNDAPSKVVILNAKGYRTESDFNGQKMIQVYTDKAGWAVNPMTGATEPQVMPDQQYKAGAEQIYAVPFLDYTARGSKAELLGQEKVGDVNAYKIKLTKDNVSTTYFIDPATYGWVVPEDLQIDMGGQFSLTLKVNKVEVNKPVDANLFTMPGKK
jgi:hypothetical protein